MPALLTPPAAAATPPAAPPPAAAGPPLYLDRLHRFTVDQYHAMIAAGILHEGRGAELLEGCVVLVMPKGSPHRTALNKARKRLDAVLPAGLNSQIQDPITLSAHTEPEPGYTVFRGSDDDFRGRHPGPADVLLVVEVADSSRHSDRRDKGAIYAAAGLPEYWIVNLADRRVEVYTQPQPAADPPAYAGRTDFPDGAAVPLTLDGAAVALVPVADLLP
jgi:Uma2 family endonuclease